MQSPVMDASARTSFTDPSNDSTVTITMVPMDASDSAGSHGAGDANDSTASMMVDDQASTASANGNVTSSVSQPPPRAPITFSVRPRKRAAPADGSQHAKQRRVDAAGNQSLIAPSKSPHPQSTSPSVNSQSQSRRSQPLRDKGSGSPADSEQRASRILFSQPFHSLLSPTDLVNYLSENEKSKMHHHYSQLWARKQKERELSSKRNHGQSPSLSSLLTHIQDESVHLNISSHFPLGKDREGKDLFSVTRFRGGSAIEQVLNKAGVSEDGNPPQWLVSFTLSLYQHGLSINSDDKNFHPYTGVTLAMLHSIDNGEIPSFLVTLANSAQYQFPLHFYDGCIIVQIRDFRQCSAMTALTNSSVSHNNPTIINNPVVHHCLLRPTPETVYSDIQHLVHEHHLAYHFTPSEMTEVCGLIENEILKHSQPSLCLLTTPRVYQILNIAHYNRRKAQVQSVSRYEQKLRISELSECMRETLFGLDVPVMTSDGHLVSATPSSHAQSATVTAASLLEKFPLLSAPVLKLLQTRASNVPSKDGKAAVMTVKKEEMNESDLNTSVADSVNDARSTPVSQTRRIKEEASPPTMSVVDPTNELVNVPKLPPSELFHPLLAYASYIYHTEQSRHNAASNTLLLDPLTRRTTLSGPQAQERRAEAIHRDKLATHSASLKSGALTQQNGAEIPAPVKEEPITILSTFPSLNIHDKAVSHAVSVNSKQHELWTVYKMSYPASANTTRKLMLELHIHSIGIKLSAQQPPPSQSQPSSQPQLRHELPTGRYEAYLRISQIDSHEAPTTPICCSPGTEADMKRFVERFLRLAMREGREVITHPTVSSKPTIQIFDEHSFMQELESKAGRWALWDQEQKQKMQAQQATLVAQQAATAAQTPTGRRTTAGKTAGKQPTGAAPHSTLGLPGASHSSYAPAGSSTAQPMTSRMPAGYSNYSSRVPAGGPPAATATSPNPINVAISPSHPPPSPHSNGGGSTPIEPLTFRPPPVPQPHHRESHPSRQHLQQQAGLYPPSASTPSLSPQPLPHAQPPNPATLNSSMAEQQQQQQQQQRLRDNQRALQQRAYQQQMQRTQQQGSMALSPNPGTRTPTGYQQSNNPATVPQPQQQHPVQAQQYAEYQQRKLMAMQQQQQQHYNAQGQH